MATVAIVLNTTKKLATGEYTVSMRIYHEKAIKYISIKTLIADQSLKLQCTTNQWKPAEAEDNGLGKFNRSVPQYKELNTVLSKKLNEAQNIIKEYDETGVVFSLQRFECDLKRGKMPTLVQDYYKVLMDNLDKQHKIGLLTIYAQTKSGLGRFDNKALITDIDVKFLERYEAYLRFERGNVDTTISIQMRNIQRVINLAIEDKIFKQENYPFGEKKYCVKKRLNHKTRKRSVPVDIIAKIKYLELEDDSALQLARNIFLFSFYTRGMNFIDIAGLKWTDIYEDEIHYIRKKTGQSFDLPINEHTAGILEFYRTHNTNPGGYVFPVYDSTIHLTLKQQYTRKNTAMKAVNDNLKTIAKRIGEAELKLTTYVSRHSYATNLKRSGVATSYISEALGHQTEQQTQTYLDGFEKGVISGLESKIFDF